MFTKRTLSDANLTGKRVLLRADYNVPITDDGTVGDDYRMQGSIATIREILKHNTRLIICSHLGRPDGKPNKKYSLKYVAAHLSGMLNQDVAFVDDCVGPEVEKAVEKLNPGDILLLENLRFHPEEEQNDDDFAKQLAKLADVFVQDGFGVVHRAHASTEAITHHLPSYAGLLLEKEVDTITNVMKEPKRPLMAIVGGAKITDKIDILNTFIELADFIAIGGAMANTFLAAQGVDVAKSKYDEKDTETALDILAKAHKKAKNASFVFYVPQDAVVATTIDKNAKTRIVDWSTHTIADVEHYPKTPPRSASTIAENEMILDIGPFSGAFIAGGMQLAQTVIWNGTMGVTETPALNGPIGPFAHGTELIIEGLLGEHGHKPFSLIGGGDTAGYVAERKLTKSFNHVSTGGGASLELMAGRTLPGVAALPDK